MTGGMRIAMLTPVFWPEVRRGTERMLHELSTGLAAKGHQPRILTSHRRRYGWSSEHGVRICRVPRLPAAPLRRWHFEDHLTHVPFSYVALRAMAPEVAHAWFPTDALAAVRYGRSAGRPVVHSYMGIPDRMGLAANRGRLRITLQAVKGSDVTVALSRHVADEFRRWLGIDAPVIWPPVDVDTFRPGARRTLEPTVVCAASLGDAEDRKRVALLLRAWPIVRRQRPTARLVLDRSRAWAGAEARDDGIEFADLDDREQLARSYAEAWASALPSRGEAFGLVLAEAMACGTPAVGANSGGIPEVIDSPAVGRLFEGEDEREVARAILEAFELASDPSTREACRSRAMAFSTASCTDAYERLYAQLLDNPREVSRT